MDAVRFFSGDLQLSTMLGAIARGTMTGLLTLFEQENTPPVRSGGVPDTENEVVIGDMAMEDRRSLAGQATSFAASPIDIIIAHFTRAFNKIFEKRVSRGRRNG
jgi:hypothetical protein